MKRRVIQLSSNTLVVSLPAQWVRKNRIRKGNELDIEEFENHLMLSSAKKFTYGAITIDVSNMDPMIKRILGALYKSGYDSIKVKFSNLSELKTIQEVIREEFLGFEVVEQKKDWLIFKKVSNIDTKEFNTMIRRMFLIVLQMAEDSLEAVKKKDVDWLEAIALHDKDVNKIADFCRRILNTTGVESFKRVPPAYFIVEQLEKIGDLYRDLCLHFLKHTKKPSQDLKNIYQDTNSFFRSFYELFFDFDMVALRDFAKERYVMKKVFEKQFISLGKNELRSLFFLHSIVESVFDMNGPLMAIYF